MIWKHRVPATRGRVVACRLIISRFDIEPLLTSRAERSQPGFWNDVEEEKSGVRIDEGLAVRSQDSSLPRALERVFCWLEEVEAGHHNVRVGYTEYSYLLRI